MNSSHIQGGVKVANNICIPELGYKQMSPRHHINTLIKGMLIKRVKLNPSLHRLLNQKRQNFHSEEFP